MDSPHAKKHLRRLLGLGLVSVLLALTAGCGGMKAPPASAQSGGGAAYEPPPPPPESPAAGTAATPGAPDRAYGGGRAETAKEAPSPSAADRPGLGTEWGETRASYIKTTTFYRANEGEPSALATIWYNDREGARAQAAAEGYRTFDQASVPVGQQAITVTLRDGSGRPLPGYSVNGKTFAIGEAGDRYSIVLTNHTPARFEIVASVDGLDVLDGRPASFSKRGYILNPHATLEIDGFRQSESAVAAFRFGSVRGSYAARKGDDRNVGVIGVAVFHERGYRMWPWDPQEVERRRNADPFPNRYATPPQLWSRALRSSQAWLWPRALRSSQAWVRRHGLRRAFLQRGSRAGLACAPGSGPERRLASSPAWLALRARGLNDDGRAHRPGLRYGLGA